MKNLSSFLKKVVSAAESQKCGKLLLDFVFKIPSLKVCPNNRPRNILKYQSFNI